MWSRENNFRGQGKGLQKIRDQRPTFREQTLSRPKARMVEAMAKDLGHNFLNYNRQIFHYFFAPKHLR